MSRAELPQPNDPIEVIGESPHLALVRRNGWSYVRRQLRVRVVAVVAVTPENDLLLVEQFRVPVGCKVIELPAGLAGDEADQNESLQAAAERELLEETGYAAAKWTELANVTSSAGLTDEVVTIFRAEGLTRVAEGGGIDGENIMVHEVKLGEVDTWLRRRDQLVDGRVYAALHWAVTG